MGLLDLSTTTEKTDMTQNRARAELLALAEKCGAKLTGKPDGSESVTVVFTCEAWRAFDAALATLATLDEGARATKSTDFIRRTNVDYAAWCKTYYTAEALDARGMMSLHGLWAWQEQERRLTAAVSAEQERCVAACKAVHKDTGECPELALHCVDRIREGKARPAHLTEDELRARLPAPKYLYSDSTLEAFPAGTVATWPEHNRARFRHFLFTADQMVDALHLLSRKLKA